MKWRVYRLPGSREIWHVDAGPKTPVFNVRGYRSNDSYSVDIGGNNVPRAWIQVDEQELHIINGIAVFEIPGVMEAVREVLDTIKKDRQ